MFKCELKFDENKAMKSGYSMKKIYQITDRIFEKIGVPKVSDGIYEDKNTDDSNLTMETTFRLLDCPVVVHFCNYWRMYDPEEGDQGECEKNIGLMKKYL